ncbi:hypothetical protein D3C73_1311240 [compost metagenome]
MRGYRLQIFGRRGCIRLGLGNLRIDLNDCLNERNFEMDAGREHIVVELAEGFV